MSFGNCNENQVVEGVVCPRRCRGLWASVLLEQVRLAGVVCPTSVDKQLDIDRARKWLGSRDFHIVCDLAGVDGGAVFERLRPMLVASGRVA